LAAAEQIMMRVEVKPELLRWARERSMIAPAALAERFPRLDAWELGEVQPTLKQLEGFANATHAPIGYFFLSAPPVERMPIPDFRTVAGRHVVRPSPDLLDTIHLCQQRQEWYREFARSIGERPMAAVGSVSVTTDTRLAAAQIREAIGFDLDERRRIPTWTDALRRFIELADAAGVMVMVSGVVGSNNRRKLDPEEFRGFALADSLAPLVFLNGSDSKAAQMFTLAHAPASASRVRSSSARSKAALRSPRLSVCWASRRWQHSRNWDAIWGSLSDGVPSRRERLHRGEEPSLRPRLLPGVLGLARREAGRGDRVQR
jgi:transcriptional regulator with XRE-family HTH domain